MFFNFRINSVLINVGFKIDKENIVRGQSPPPCAGESGEKDLLLFIG